MKFVQIVMLVGISSMVGCSSKVIEIESNDERFPGFHPALSPGKQTDVLIVHGMCSKSDQWFADHVKEFSKTVKPIVPSEIIEGDVIDGIQLSEAVIESSSGVLNLYGVIYSGATENAKKGLTEAIVPGERAWINKNIKKFAMNDCLADVVTYIGPVGTKIRARIREILSDIQARRQEKREKDKVVLISESLGSKIVRDSLLCDPNESAADALKLLSNSDLFVMYANQIPFLDLASDENCDLSENNSTLSSFGLSEDEMTGDLSDVLRILNQPGVLGFAPEVAETPRHWVAFSDPNDILSYQLDISKYEDLKVTNVSLANTTNWFGFFANPSKAHNGYKSNSEVRKMILFGCTIKNNKCETNL